MYAFQGCFLLLFTSITDRVIYNLGFSIAIYDNSKQKTWFNTNWRTQKRIKHNLIPIGRHKKRKNEIPCRKNVSHISPKKVSQNSHRVWTWIFKLFFVWHSFPYTVYIFYDSYKHRESLYGERRKNVRCHVKLYQVWIGFVLVMTEIKYI